MCDRCSVRHGTARPTNTKPVESRLSAARQQLQQAYLPQAKRTLRDALALAPTNAEAHYLLAYVLFRETRAKDSLADYTAAAHLRQPNAEELAIVASDYVFLKDFPDADKWLRDATTLAPNDPQIWYLLGRTQYNEDHVAADAHSFERCLALRPQDIRAQYNLGLANEKIERPADAIAAYETAIRWQTGHAQQDPQPYLDLGTFLLCQKKFTEALDPPRQDVRYGPANALASQQLGLAFEALGRVDEAIAALKRAADLAPNAEQPHLFLGRIYAVSAAPATPRQSTRSSRSCLEPTPTRGRQTPTSNPESSPSCPAGRQNLLSSFRWRKILTSLGCTR